MQPQTLPELLEVAATNRPNQIAIRCLDEQYTYAQLFALVNKLAYALQREGVAPGDRVGVVMSQGVLSMVALHAIMRAGAAYVPLDPKAPTHRLASCTEQCELKVLVTDGQNSPAVDSLADQSTTVGIVIGEDESVAARSIGWDSVTAMEDRDFPSLAQADGLAYVIFTSGSTGEPKGVTHTHASSLAYVLWAQQAYGVAATDRLANQSALHFDISIFDLFVANAAGATCVVVPPAYTRFPASYARLLADCGVTVVFTVPYVLSGLVGSEVLNDVALPDLRLVIFGGDGHVVSDINQLIRRWPHVRFSHMYGPAETNGCTYQILEQGAQQSEDYPIHIGQECPGMHCRVVDDGLVDVTKGSPGELLIAGPSLMRGYWNQPQRNAEVLVRLPDSTGEERLYYRSGDQVCELPDGNFRFLGRQDRMVKVRGHRVELDEIELALGAHPAVQEAAVVADVDALGSKEILAAVLLREAASPADLMAYLATAVPPYAKPTMIRVLKRFPRTGTGKLDRRALLRQIGTTHP